jgi:hypothetical protein
MKSKSAKFVLVAISFLFASALSAQHVKTHYDRTANFAQYKTYSWGQVKTTDPLDVARIKSAVNAALAAKGWTRVESGGDVWIVAIEGRWRSRGFGAFGPTTDTYEDRTLTVDLFDTKTKKLLWRGSSTDRLSNRSDKDIKNLDNGWRNSSRSSLRVFTAKATKLNCYREYLIQHDNDQEVMKNED